MPRSSWRADAVSATVSIGATEFCFDRVVPKKAQDDVRLRKAIGHVDVVHHVGDYTAFHEGDEKCGLVDHRRT